jgi:hypothetical protein
VQVKLWGVDMDNPANQLGASSAELAAAMQHNQQDMTSNAHTGIPIPSAILQRYLHDRNRGELPLACNQS